MLIFQNGTQKQLFAHAEAEYPGECCGILLGRQEEGKRSVCCVLPAENTAGNKKNAHFQLDPLEVLWAEAAAEQRQLEIVGFYHSHPDRQAVASGEDLRHMIPGYSYPILAVRKGRGEEIRSFEKSSPTGPGTQEEILIKEK